jgi:hypothetical protein
VNKETSEESECAVARGYCDVLQASFCEEIKVELGALLPFLTGFI